MNELYTLYRLLSFKVNILHTRIQLSEISNADMSLCNSELHLYKTQLMRVQLMLETPNVSEKIKHKFIEDTLAFIKKIE